MNPEGNQQLEEQTEGDTILEYRVEGLRPATAYALRLAAVNDIGDSDYSDPVILQTLEECKFLIYLYISNKPGVTLLSSIPTWEHILFCFIFFVDYHHSTHTVGKI